MPQTPFVTLIFRGARFDEPGFPLEVLPELAGYRDLVLAVAKDLWQRAHPQRQRLPKGFEASLQLVLEGIEETNSVAPLIARTHEEATLFPLLGGHDYFEQARQLIERSMHAASTEQIPDLSSELLARFSSFGKSLGDDESILVGPPGQKEGVTYNRAVRRQLLLRAHRSYEDNVDLRGEVRAADKDQEAFALRLLDGRRIEVRVPPLFFPIALKSMQEEALIVRVRGVGLYDANGVLQRVTQVNDVSLLEEDEQEHSRGAASSVEDQIAALKGLQQGWFDGIGAPYDEEDLSWLQSLLSALIASFELPTPYLYPTPEGEARAEWSGREWETILEVNPKKKTASAVAVSVLTRNLEELEASFIQAGAESRLGRFLRTHLD